MKIKNLFLAVLALLAFNACTFIPESPYEFPISGGAGGAETEEGVYINETFASGFGVFSTVETVGEYPWVIDYKTAKATSYVDGANKTATSWLISDPVDFTNETEAFVTFDYIIRYAESGKVAKNHQLLISSNYNGDAAAATWTDIPYNAKEGADWQTFYKANVAVPSQFIGKNGIVFALRYTATSKAGTWEVKNFKVKHGKPEEGEEEKPEDAAEYTVSEALEAFTGAAKPAVIKGYIVGTVNGQVYEEGCIFSGTAESKTNILIADSPDETDYNNCMPVQLPSGNVRNKLNLAENPSNYKKYVELTGSLEKYFGVTGLKTVTKYVLDGVSSEEPSTPEAPKDSYIYETFSTDFGSFTTQETVGNYPWIIDFKTAKATSYDSGTATNNVATSWLISPPVNLSNETEAYIAFEYIIRYAEAGKVADNHQLLVSKDYNGNAATATWKNVPYNAVEGSDWTTFYKANVAVPAEFIGCGNVVFALRYTATEKAGTWEVRNFTVAHGKATAGDSGTEEPEKAEEYTVSGAIGAFTGTAKPAIIKGYIVGTINGQVYSTGCVFSEAAETMTNLLLADNADETDYNKCIPVQLPIGEVRSKLNLADNPDNYKKFVTLTGSLEKYFGVPGLKSVTKFVIDGAATDEPETPGTPETPAVPEGTNLLYNGGLEEWDGDKPANWATLSTSNAIISQSNEAYEGSYSAVVGGAASNKRFASQSYTLEAGTYTMVAYVKANGSEAGFCRLGYAVLSNGVAITYKYETPEASAVTSDWVPRIFEFTLDKETEISLIVMNNKNSNGASFLVDDIRLIKK